MVQMIDLLGDYRDRAAIQTPAGIGRREMQSQARSKRSRVLHRRFNLRGLQSRRCPHCGLRGGVK